jgi:hypothetical protein
MAAILKTGAKYGDEIALVGLKAGADDIVAAGLKNVDLGDIAKNIDVGDIAKNIDVGGLTDLGDIVKNIDVGDVAKNADVGDVAKNADELGDVAENADELGDVAKLDMNNNFDFDKISDIFKGLGENIDSVSKKLDDIVSGFPIESLDDLKTIVKNNPGKTLGAAVLVALGVTGITMAIDEFNKNNNKKVGIIKSYASNTGMLDFLSTTQDIIIQFTPSAKIVNGDKVEISNSDFSPSINNNTYTIKEIISDTSIVISVPKISTFATKGTLTIKTTQENHIINVFKEGSQTAGSTVGTVVGTTVSTAVGTTVGVAGGVVSGVGSGLFGDYYNYIKYLLYCVAFIIILGVIYKLYTLASAFS